MDPVSAPLPWRQVLRADFHAFTRKLAPKSDIRLWILLALGIGVTMLIGVTITASSLIGNPNQASSILLDEHPFFESVGVVFARNLLVLSIHLAACYVGAIIGRPHKPLTGRMARFSFMHRELPAWAAKIALAYALVATIASVALQTTGLGFTLADISAAIDLKPWQLTLLVTPHALLELTGVFLPLALFLIQAKRGVLTPLSMYTRQAAYIALPMILLAAFIEVYITPHLILSFL
jgi:hypothetical protein